MWNVQEQFLDHLAACIRLGYQAIIQDRPEACPEAVRWLDALEYWADDPDCLQDCADGVAARCHQILSAEKEMPRPVLAHRTGRGSSSTSALHCKRSRKQCIIGSGAGQGRGDKWRR